MTEQDDIDVLAGEYVLGTLDAVERATIDSRRRSEPALDAAIVAWEGRLDPLSSQTASIAPPEGLFAKIEARLGEGAPAHASAVADSAVVVHLQRRVGRWRFATAAATALAACLAVVVLVREILPARQAENFVAVFNESDTRPAFVMSIDLKSREVTIRPVGAQRHAGKTYQLWILAKSLGPAPQSLGLLDGSLAPTRKRLPGIEPAVLQNATFGISLEPEGGSPTGRPTGPAIHGKLIPTMP